MQRRDFLRLVACATGTAALGGNLSSRGAKAAAAKPQKLNLLYATAEADSEAIKLVLPDFASKLGIKLNLETFPYAALQQKVFAFEQAQTGDLPPLEKLACKVRAAALK